MSWLSELFGGGGDDPMAAERLRQDAEDRRQREAQTRLDAEKAEARTKALALRSNASTAGRNSAQQYFSNLGLDPNEYTPDIDNRISEVLGITAEDDPNVGSYLADLGQQIYSNREGALRTRSGRDVDMMFQPEFERSRIADTADDDILSQINTAERGEADAFVDNLFKRGVITEAGRSGASRNLDDQGSRVRGILDEIGQSVLSGGRQNLTDIANRGRQTAQTLKLGQSFDPSTYGTQADQSSTSFLGGLGDKIKGRITDDLYDTSGLGAIAGAAQGAGNTKFDPNALAGVISDEEDEDDPLRQRRLTF